MATLFGMVSHQKTTKKVDKVRKQLRMFIGRVNPKRLVVLIAQTNDSWEKVKTKTDENEIMVSLARTCLILYDLLAVKQAVISEKNMMLAVGSLEYGYDICAKIESDTNRLTDMFRDELGITVHKAKTTLASRIALAKQTKKFNDILEGKS